MDRYELNKIKIIQTYILYNFQWRFIKTRD